MLWLVFGWVSFALMAASAFYWHHTALMLKANLVTWEDTARKWEVIAKTYQRMWQQTNALLDVMLQSSPQTEKADGQSDTNAAPETVDRNEHLPRL